MLRHSQQLARIGPHAALNVLRGQGDLGSGLPQRIITQQGAADDLTQFRIEGELLILRRQSLGALKDRVALREII